MAKASQPFYLYRILGEMGETVYIGKGTGSRLAQQMRRFQSDGEIIERHSSEDKAYERERELIALHNPPLNVSRGGLGGRYGSVVGEEENMFRGLAKVIRRLPAVTSDKRVLLERLVCDIAEKYGHAKFAARLRRYNTVVHEW